MDNKHLLKLAGEGDVIGVVKQLLSEVERLEAEVKKLNEERDTLYSLLSPAQFMYLMYGGEDNG